MSSDGVIAGFVIDEADQCIIGARVELIGGPRAGSSYVQTLCGFWDYGDDIGYSFRLPIGVPQIVHASAAGYRPAERTFAATMPYQYTNYITLKKDP